MASLMEALGIDKLSVDERLQLIDEIWASLGPEANDLPLTTEQMAEIARRLADADANPEDVVSWETVRTDIEERLKR
jgi:putative addiction module component (TIGR02574 family)